MPNGSSIGSAVFAWLMPHYLYVLQCAVLFPPKFALTLYDLDPYLILCTHQTHHHINGISIKLAGF